MKYNHLGKSGLEVSELSFGSWITFGSNLRFDPVKESVKCAYEAGVNFFDTAEIYAHGEAESLLGKAIKELKIKREEVVISTKLFWGGQAPNQTGLSRKHLIEGTKNSLRRLKMDYVDLIYCHRPDPNTPLEETVFAMDNIVRSGLAFYWGTSEWPADKIEAAHQFAKEYKLIPPTMEQPEYNMFSRVKVEKDYLPLYEKYGMGTTTWSPLASGILTGKYNKGIPKGSRMDRVSWLKAEFDNYKMFSEEVFHKIDKLTEIARDLGCSMTQLALAWCLTNKHVSTVIIGASNKDQLKENLKSAEIKEKVTPDILVKIDHILQNKP